MTEHYLDNSATTQVCTSAAKMALDMMTVEYGNPSSLHSKGIKAECFVEKARLIIAKSLGCEEDEIYFTSGGTEANNTALFGVADAKKRLGKKIVTTAVEHSSVMESAKRLESLGYEVVYLSPDKSGAVSYEQLYKTIDENTVLVSVMCVNNETGALMPVDKIKKIIKAKNSPALFHTDAVQAYGKALLKVKKIGCDLMSISSHKVHGPKGVGALYIKKGVRITPLIYGGEQQKKLRPGTESTPLICAFGEAVKEFDIDKNKAIVKELNSYARGKLSLIDGVCFNNTEDCSEYIINISVKGIRSETMLHHLASNGIYVSSGSACGKGKKSYVLTAMGISDDLADSALRISFSKYNTKEDVDALVSSIESGVATLARKKI